MQRIFGALAIFGGWLSILVSAVSGLIATQFLGLNHVEGDLPPVGLYGVPAVTVMWVAVATAVLTAVPAAAAMIAPDPSRRLYVAAAVMGVTGVALLPADLGRAYAAAIIPGAALFATGGWLTHKAGAIGAESTAPAAAGATATDPAREPGPAEAEPSGVALATGAQVVDTPVVSTAPGSKRPARLSAKAAAKSLAASQAECPWCSATIAAGAERCPSCGAALTSTAESIALPIPGVTAVKPELREYQQKAAARRNGPGLLSMVLGAPDDRLFGVPAEPVDSEALRPPSAEVRAEMERLDREIAAAAHTGESAAEDKPGGATATEPGGATATEPGGATATEPGGATATEPGGATATEPGGATATEPGGAADGGAAAGSGAAAAAEPGDPPASTRSGSDT